MQYNREVVLHFSIWSSKGYQVLMEAVRVKQTDVFEAAEYFARVEDILPAPESSHAIRVAIDEALKCKKTGEEKTSVFGLTGTGYFDDRETLSEFSDLYFTRQVIPYGKLF